MGSAEKRSYKGRKFGVNIATSVSPKVFYEIESLGQQLGVKKAEVVRRLVVRGLAECQRHGTLSALEATPEEPASGFSSEVHGDPA